MAQFLLNPGSIVGRCTVYDPETGDIDDSNVIVWSSSIDGFLGNGNILSFHLSVGEHILTATATDPEAKTGTDTVHVKVHSIASDFNCDLRVDCFDLAELADRWLATCSTPDWCGGTDLDHNGVVDNADFAEFANHWLEGTTP